MSPTLFGESGSGYEGSKLCGSKSDVITTELDSRTRYFSVFRIRIHSILDSQIRIRYNETDKKQSKFIE